MSMKPPTITITGDVSGYILDFENCWLVENSWNMTTITPDDIRLSCSPKRVAEAARSLVLRLEEGSHLESENLGETRPFNQLVY